MSSAQAITAWAVSACAVLGMLVRPLGTREWMWAVAGAAILVATGALGAGRAWSAIAAGADVYAFLIGILAISEVARAHGLFDWLAERVVRAAGGSRARLFGLLYVAGALVTVLLSNDTTVVVLTPAVLAALARTDAEPLPYLYSCALVANAASFVLPISNPANLVLFGHGLPPLVPWIRAFGLAAVASVVLTFAVLRFGVGGSVSGLFALRGTSSHTQPDRLPVTLVLISALALVFAALLGLDVGYTALAFGALSLVGSLFAERSKAAQALRHVSWTIVPLVAGLFVIVAALDRSGAVSAARQALDVVSSLGPLPARLSTGAAVTLVANIFNNLPVGMLAGLTLRGAQLAPGLGHAVLVAVDLGPNLSVTGSLATLLWLMVLRRDGIEVTGWQFVRTGALVLAPALLGALLLVR